MLTNRTHFFLLLALWTGFSEAQVPAQTALMTPQSTVIIPIATGTLGRKDPGAIAELSRHLSAVGVGAWLGMQATGTITYGSDDQTAYNVTLSNQGGDKFRLDTQMPKGLSSVRILRKGGRIQDVDGKISWMPVSTAMSGIFPFELARSSRLANESVSLRDQGSAVIDGRTFHRITVEEPSLGNNPATRSTNTSAMDLYFDPASHLLMKSAVSTSVSGARDADFLFVVTYSDYRMVGATMVPFRFTETMQGELFRTVQLTDVQIHPAFDSAYFKF